MAAWKTAFNLLNNHDRNRFDLTLCCLSEPGSMAARLRPDVQFVCIGMPEGKRQLLYVPELAPHFSGPVLMSFMRMAGEPGRYMEF